MPAMKKMYLLILLVAGSLHAGEPCHSATNLALNKPYTVFPLPNYQLTAPATDKAALTDGSYTGSGILWIHKATVGWQNTRTVRILIDLRETYVIDGITFSTARGNLGDVNFPKRISAFVGPDKDHLLYVGDIASGVDHSAVKYVTQVLALYDIGAKGRFVLLDIELKGYYLFCDEIEVLEGEWDKGRTGRLTIDEGPRLVVDRAILQGLVEQLRPQLAGQPHTIRLIEIEQRIRAAHASRDETRAIETDLLKLRGEALSDRFPEREFLIEAISPWGKFSTVSAPSDILLTQISFFLAKDGYDHAAFMITNVSHEAREVLLTLDTGAADAPAMSLYKASFVQSAGMEYVPDPLVPVKGGLTLRSGESQMLLMAAQGNMPGAWHSRLKIDCGGTAVSVPVESRVVKVAIPKPLSLNSVNWNYLDFKPTRYMKPEAMKDLLAHHTNVGVVYPAELALADPPAVEDFIRMNKAFDLHKNTEKVLLFMNLRNDRLLTCGGKYEFMSQGWKEWFRGWYYRVTKAYSALGFTQERVYLYPFDEMSDKEIDQFIVFAAWVRQEIPNIRLYATLGAKNSERALPFLDIAQVTNNDDVLKKFNDNRAEVWIYSADGLAKSLSPYAYYRLMAWKAFLRGYRGIGFWAYADTGWEGSSAWDDFDGKYPDFAVIYEGSDNSIISSRRWEAWRIGIEDYELLTMYAGIKGIQAAKTLAKMVYEHPEDTSKADEIRRRILVELADETN